MDIIGTISSKGAQMTNLLPAPATLLVALLNSCLFSPFLVGYCVTAQVTKPETTQVEGQARDDPRPAENDNRLKIRTSSAPAPAGSGLLDLTAGVGRTAWISPGTILRVSLDGPSIRLSKLKPGATLNGKLQRSIYIRDREVLPAGSAVQVTVDKVEKRKLERKKAKGVFARLEQFRNGEWMKQTSYAVSLHPARVTIPSGATLDLKTSFLRTGQVIALRPKGADIKIGGGSGALGRGIPGVPDINQAKSAKDNVQAYRHPVLTLQLEEPASVPTESAPTATVGPAAAALAELPQVAASSSSNSPITVGAGARARLLLLTSLSASESREGERFQARLIEPVFVDGRMLLPEGCLFEGHVRKVSSPGRMNRGGALRLAFDTISLPDGPAEKVNASLSEADLDSKERMKMDEEGTLKGGNRDKKQLATDLLGSLLMAKLAEKAIDTPIALAIGAASHAASSYLGLGTGILFFLARTGKDVDLPKYTELEITFGRVLTIPAIGSPIPAPDPDNKNPATVPTPQPVLVPEEPN